MGVDRERHPRVCAERQDGRKASTAALVAKLPVQTCRFKLRISVNLCANFGGAFLDTTGARAEECGTEVYADVAYLHKVVEGATAGSGPEPSRRAPGSGWR